MTKGDYIKIDAERLSPIMNLNCIINKVNNLMTHFQNVDKDAFFGKYGRLTEIMKVEVLSSALRALVHFWDLDYHCFFFWKHRSMSYHGRIWDVDGISK